MVAHIGFSKCFLLGMGMRTTFTPMDFKYASLRLSRSIHLGIPVCQYSPSHSMTAFCLGRYMSAAKIPNCTWSRYSTPSFLRHCLTDLSSEDSRRFELTTTACFLPLADGILRRSLATANSASDISAQRFRLATTASFVPLSNAALKSARCFSVMLAQRFRLAALKLSTNAFLSASESVFQNPWMFSAARSQRCWYSSGGMFAQYALADLEARRFRAFVHLQPLWTSEIRWRALADHTRRRFASAIRLRPLSVSLPIA